MSVPSVNRVPQLLAILTKAQGSLMGGGLVRTLFEMCLMRFNHERRHVNPVGHRAGRYGRSRTAASGNPCGGLRSPISQPNAPDDPGSI
jgi:hypothetical protein